MLRSQRSLCPRLLGHWLLLGTLLVTSNSRALAGVTSPDWRYGIASVDITPAEPVLLSGYGGRNKPHESVNHPLRAKALALEDAEGHRAALLTADLVSIGGQTAEAVCQKVMAATGLRRDQFLLNVSHTHAGPEVWMEDARGDTPAHEATRRNILVLRDKLATVMIQSLSHLQPASLSRGLGVASFVMSRREFTDQGIKLGVNPRGYADRGVPVLRIDGADGRVRAVVFGTACHPTTSGGKNYAIDPDFPGHAQEVIERAFPGTVALFVAGCGADANPYPRGTLELAAQHGQALGTEVKRVLGEKLLPVRGPLRTGYKEIDLPLRPAPAREELEILANNSKGGGWERWTAKQMLEMLAANRSIPTSARVPVACWQFGTNLTLVALPCEPVADYVMLLERRIGPLNLWVAGYCNEVFGYLPSQRVLAEGGYETRGIDTGPGAGQFTPQVESLVLDTVANLARQAGRPVP